MAREVGRVQLSLWKLQEGHGNVAALDCLATLLTIEGRGKVVAGTIKSTADAVGSMESKARGKAQRWTLGQISDRPPGPRRTRSHWIPLRGCSFTIKVEFTISELNWIEKSGTSRLRRITASCHPPAHAPPPRDLMQPLIQIRYLHL